MKIFIRKYLLENIYQKILFKNFLNIYLKLSLKEYLFKDIFKNVHLKYFLKLLLENLFFNKMNIIKK